MGCGRVLDRPSCAMAPTKCACFGQSTTLMACCGASVRGMACSLLQCRAWLQGLQRRVWVQWRRGRLMLSRCDCACPAEAPLHAVYALQTRLMAQQKSEGAVRYRGFLHALVTIPREEGLRAMWRGLLPRLMRIPPGQAIVWAVSDQITGYFERRQLEASGQLLRS